MSSSTLDGARTVRKAPRSGVVVLAVLAGLVACSSDSATSSDGGEFEQTWPLDYAETTCTDWLAEMTPDQQRVAAADMLVGARDQDGGSSLPSDEEIERFQTDISMGCEPVGELTIAEVGATIYILDPDYAP